MQLVRGSSLKNNTREMKELYLFIVWFLIWTTRGQGNKVHSLYIPLKIPTLTTS